MIVKFKYVAAVLEQVQGQVQAVAESLDLTRNELNQKIDGVEKSLRQEIHYTQLAIKGVKDDTVRIEKKLNQVEENLSEKIDRVAEKVEHYDEEIVFLKAAVAK